MLQCVTCKADTVEREHEGVVAHACPEGHGLWLQPNDLLEAVRTDPASGGHGSTYEERRALSLVQDRDIEAGDVVRTCPTCGDPMGSVRYALTSDVVIDACTRHGVWLDDGELEALEAWAAKRYDADSPEMQAFTNRVTARNSGEVDTIELRVGALDWVRSLIGRR